MVNVSTSTFCDSVPVDVTVYVPLALAGRANLVDDEPSAAAAVVNGPDVTAVRKAA
jgi:hypothetical protein